MEWFEAEELAVAVLGYCDDDELDSETIENKMEEQFGVGMSQFQAIADALMPLTIPGESPLSGELFHGFVKDGSFVVKTVVKEGVHVEK